MPIELDPLTYGLTIWDLEPGVPHRRRRRQGEDGARRPARRAARRLLPHDRRRVHAHPGHRGAALDPVQGRGDAGAVHQGRRSTGSSSGSTPPRRSRSSSPPSTSAPSASGSRAPSRRSRSSTRSSRRRPTPGCDVVRHRHGPPRPPQRAVEHHRQELRGDLPRVRGPRRPDVGAGLRRRQVPPRRHRQVRQPRRAPTSMLELAANPSHLETVDPIVDGHGARRPGPDRAARLVPGAADPDPRRRRLRRPGRGRRDAGDERHHRLPRRRHDPPDHQQPDRLHDGAGVRPLVAVLQRRGQDRAGADLPRQRRRPRGVRARGPAGLRVPPAVPQGRRHRHVVLPAPRSQRGRRPELHPAADVQGDRRAPQRAQAVRRVARQARRHHRSTRPSRRSPTSRRKLQVALDETRAAGDRRRSRRPARPSRSACCRTSRPASSAARSTGSSPR